MVVHRIILHGLRAPRVAHAVEPGADSGARAVWLDGPGGKRLFAWHLPAPGQPAACAPAVVLMHGWGSNAAMLLPVAKPLQAAGWHVLLPDARCHGRSDDEAYTSLPRFAEDIDAALDWLREQPGVDRTRLAVVGHSVGAGAALLCATRRHDLSAVVSVSAFAHPDEVMRRWLAERRLPFAPIGWYVLRHVQRVIGARFDDFAPLSTIGKVSCAVLIVHGSLDETVPFDDALRLLAAARPGNASVLRVSAGHDLSPATDGDLRGLIDFLAGRFRRSGRDGHQPRIQQETTTPGLHSSRTTDEERPARRPLSVEPGGEMTCET
jgi:uncharacterized protein